MKRLIPFVVLVCTTLSFGQFTPDQSKWYRIIFLQSGLCLRPTNGTTGNYIQLEQSTIDANDQSQLWKFQEGSTAGYWYPINKNGKSMDVLGTTQSSNVGTYDFHSGDNQQFRLDASPVSGYYYMADLRSANSGANYVIDVIGASTQPGAKIDIWTKKTSGYENQVVKFVEVAGPWTRDPTTSTTQLTYPNDKLGIGTGSIDASYKLFVQGGSSGFNDAAGVNGITICPNNGGFNQIYSNHWSGTTNLPLSFGTLTSQNAMVILNNGNVGLGITNPSCRLAVNGTIRAKEIVVTAAGWPDYVFKSDYNLKPLNEVEKFIKENHHLENVPSEKEAMEKGVSVGEMQEKLLQKLEETTLYLIEMKKENEELKARLAKVESKVQ